VEDTTMLKSLACAALVAGGLTGAASAAQPLPQPTGPIVLGDELLDQVSAGYGQYLPSDTFWFTHSILAANSGGLPELAQWAIWKLHKPFTYCSD
jgi:hypothetical protein